MISTEQIMSDLTPKVFIAEIILAVLVQNIIFFYHRGSHPEK